MCRGAGRAYRIHALTVLLDREIRDDDIEAVEQAIQMIKGVMAVKRHVADVNLEWATEKARRELRDKLWAVLHPETPA